MKIEVGPSLGSSSRLKLFFRLEVNKIKDEALSLVDQTKAIL